MRASVHTHRHTSGYGPRSGSVGVPISNTEIQVCVHSCPYTHAHSCNSGSVGMPISNTEIQLCVHSSTYAHPFGYKVLDRNPAFRYACFCIYTRTPLLGTWFWVRSPLRVSGRTHLEHGDSGMRASVHTRTLKLTHGPVPQRTYPTHTHRCNVNKQNLAMPCGSLVRR